MAYVPYAGKGMLGFSSAVQEKLMAYVACAVEKAVDNLWMCCGK